MILAMHDPGFVSLAHFHPSSVYYIYATVIGSNLDTALAAFMMYLIYVDGESKTSHYSIATGFMALGMMLPGMASGFIQEYLGYGNFFSVSSHYSWINSVKILDFPVRLWKEI
jgi:PAT family beta-lactamase induction signal transducer AmpG